jgi:hypothetical protein
VFGLERSWDQNRRIGIDTWDWNQHEVKPSVKEFHLREFGVPQSKVIQIIRIFPEMANFELRDEWPDLNHRRSPVPPRLNTKIAVYAGSDILPSAMLRQVEELHLSLKLFPSMRRLIQIIPDLKNLKDFNLQMSSFLYNGVLGFPCILSLGWMKQLLKRLKENESIKRIDFSKIDPGENQIEEENDGVFVRWLNKLPERIEETKFKHRFLRSSNNP